MSGRITIGDERVDVPDLNGVKAVEALRLLQQVMRLAPDVARRRADFIRAYGEQYFEVLSRGEAKLRFGPVPVLDGEGDIARDEHGQVLTIPSPVDRMTEDDWRAMGNQLRLPQRPSNNEVGMELLDVLLDKALEPTLRLLALAVANNSEVLRRKRDGDLQSWLDDRGEELLDRGRLDQLMELALVAVETANTQVRQKLEQLGDRWGNALSAFGIKPDAPDHPQPDRTPSTDSKSTSSSDSPASTAGTSGRFSALAGAPS